MSPVIKKINRGVFLSLKKERRLALSSQLFHLTYFPNNQNGVVACIVPRTVAKNATTRNKIKRWVFAAVRSFENKTKYPLVFRIKQEPTSFKETLTYVSDTLSRLP